MSTIASTLLDFILDLLRDPEKAAAYEADPQGTLDAAGMPDTSPEEVADLMPMVTDMSTVGGWGGHGDHGQGGYDRDGQGGYDRDDEGGRGRDCDDDHKAEHHARPVDDEDGHHGDVKPVDREERDDDEEGGHSGGGGANHHAPVPAGGTETVVITRLQEVNYTYTETNVEIDASHSIWVSGDAQAIFGEVEGDVTKIDNDGGIVAGDDVEDVSIDNSDNSVSDSYNTDVEVEIEDSPINVGGSQAVDSFNGNEDNDVIAERGGQVGDNTSVRVEDSNNTDNSIDDSFNGNDLSQDNDGVDDSFNGNDLSKENVGNDYSDNSETDNSVNDSLNGNDLSDDDVRDSYNDNSDDDGVDDSLNGNDFENIGNDDSEENSFRAEDSFNDNSEDNSFNADDSFTKEVDVETTEVRAGEDADGA